MSKNKYPVSVDEQQSLWHECVEDACKISKDINLQLPIVKAFFDYRIQILSDRILDHDMLEASDEELGLLSEDGQ